MRFFVRTCSMMVMAVVVAGTFAGCAQRVLPSGPVPLTPLVATPEDRKIVIAKVNGADINRYALIDMMNHMSAMNERASISVTREETRKKALDRLIFEELAIQEARRRGLALGEGVLDRAMGTVRANVGDEEAYKTFLAKQGISEEELRDQVERLLLLQRIVDQEVIKKTSAPDADAIRQEYERQKDQFIVPGKVIVDDVVLFLDQDDPASMTKAKGILARINADKDKDPGSLALDGTFIVQHIDLDRGKAPELYDAARKLKEGELSGVIKTGDGLHIIRLTQYAPERQRSYEEVKGALEAKPKAAAQKKRLQEWDRDLRKGALIEIMDLEGRKTD